MPLKVFKPNTPAQRFRTQISFGEITKTKPEKSLLQKLTKTVGRSKGRVTARGRGDGHKRYILAPDSLRVGDKIQAAQKTEIKAGNAMPLGNMPIGTLVHNIELMPGAGGAIVRSAGTAAVVAAREGTWVHLKLPSKEVRKIHVACFATIGQVGN